MGNLATLCVLLEVLLGISGFIINKQRCCKRRWSEKEVNMVTLKIHRILGWLLLLFANMCVISGCNHYFRLKLFTDTLMMWPFLSLLVFLIVAAIGETLYRLANRKQKGKIEIPTDSEKLKNFTVSEINTAVEDGKNLMVFDNFVLALEDFREFHPGGSFFLEKNYGRDVSKFYYGGYSMISTLLPYTHSAWSIGAAERMVAGYI